ncbi:MULTISPECIES: winged helix-turn-helix domain-containing protein [unclassified Paenarthrobacter]|uniref:winged helix-turn-helix transcriptional regulator n=1 Tax=unclassified Paenarthrobacter TaxID=2634190 RepID=UPI00084EB495|nr:winged helix-turn-helix domain-containing protein [Paenarthrobacter sp. R1]NKR11160.1 hypothetical protein [Arthrobacter sp. M5]NKR14444.1 hypothetical protein [Arthrobacter sp. M6]OEH62167.1 hypothetical protein A5N13_15020 [Arthrobacter sp. D4]OEH63612.1 hypothetical protein A5N17_08235 [Arthrobacter sp. D2]WIV29249.1 winged helix-turn-helix domain-containing protein [Paenarthrobacter sp. R1]
MPAPTDTPTPSPSRRVDRIAPFWEEGQALVLVIDPDGQAPAPLLDYCRANGIRTVVEATGAAGLIAYGRTPADAVVLADTVTDIAPATVAAAIAADGTTPVLMVLATGLAEPPAAVAGVLPGYDQAPSTRILARLARRAAGVPEQLKVGSLVMRVAAFEVLENGKPVTLTLREFEILRVLMLAQGRAVPLEQLKDDVWGAVGETARTQTLKVHLNRIRSKLIGRTQPIAVRGIGYRLATAAAPSSEEALH